MSATMDEHKIGNLPGHQIPVEQIQEFGKEMRGDKTAINTPWPQLSRLMGGGFRQGEVTLISGKVGGGKSYLLLQLCLCAQIQGINWRLMPCEDTARKTLRRAVAIRTDDWAMLDESKGGAEARLNTFLSNKAEILSLSEHFCENPRRAIKDTDIYVVPPLPWSKVSDWVRRESEQCKLISIDPISMIDFDENGNEYKGQESFMKECVGIAEATGTHIILVPHLVKDRARQDRIPDTDDIEGKTAFTRFAHNILIMHPHKERESDVRVWAAGNKAVHHKRTLFLAKTRNGSGSGLRLALDFSDSGPQLGMYGIILT